MSRKSSWASTKTMVRDDVTAPDGVSMIDLIDDQELQEPRQLHMRRREALSNVSRCHSRAPDRVPSVRVAHPCAVSSARITASAESNLPAGALASSIEMMASRSSDAAAGERSF